MKKDCREEDRTKAQTGLHFGLFPPSSPLCGVVAVRQIFFRFTARHVFFVIFVLFCG